MSGIRPKGVHLVGSVPLKSAEEVFRLAASTLGKRLKRIPDGETGARINWIGWQYAVMKELPFFEPLPPDPKAYAPLPKVRLKPGTRDLDIRFGSLGYAAAARSSHATFKSLVGSGAIPKGTRFQVSLPTPLAVVNAFVTEDDQEKVEPFYERRLLEELEEIVKTVPKDQLAIQWDVAVEMAILEGVFKTVIADPGAGIQRRLAMLGDAVPRGVEVGYHLCYGDFEHHHFKQPKDASRLVEVANGVISSVRRRIDWVHMPVPRERADEEYFRPLAGLHLKPGTELYLGLVHYTDGVEGTKRRIDAAQHVRPSFGVATECGMGRRPPETIEGLLKIHAEVADPAE